MQLIPLLSGDHPQVRSQNRASPSEFEVKNDVHAAIAWDPKIYRLRYRKGEHYLGSVSNPGIYIAERDRKPVWVGIAWNQSIGARWKDRLATFRELKIPGDTERRYTVRVGKIVLTGAWKTLGRSPKDLYETVERALIRYLKKVRGYGLTNIKSRLSFTVGSMGISIENRGAKPVYLPLEIKRRSGDVLELALPMRA
jgi:hypothetical protein